MSIIRTHQSIFGIGPLTCYSSCSSIVLCKKVYLSKEEFEDRSIIGEHCSERFLYMTDSFTTLS